MADSVRTWVFGGNDPELGLGLNHLPYTAFTDEVTGSRHLGVVIGACVLDLHAASNALPADLYDALRAPTLNQLMSLGPNRWATLREALQLLLSTANKDRKLLEAALIPCRGLRLELPAKTRNYTDFYASEHHARRVGELFRPEKPLLENYAWLPIGYHGRASSLRASGTNFRRPSGQLGAGERPSFGPTRKLDYELELAFLIGQSNELGEPIPLSEADGKIFGVSLLNDWSARDTQAWEYQPLGPFLGKNFCTSVSALLTPMEALRPFCMPSAPHACGTLLYLNSETENTSGALSLRLDVSLSTPRSRAAALAPFPISRVDSRELYWTAAQMVAHHTSGGCNLQVGDVLATGTISGPERASGGCLLEQTRGGADPLTLSNGETRTFLEDGDEVILTGMGEADGEMPVRLGECRAMVIEALKP